MILKRAILTLAICFGAAGCQHDANLPPFDTTGALDGTAYDPDRYPLARDSRWAAGDAPSLRTPRVTDRSTLHLSLSVPLHPIEGVQVSHSRIVLGAYNVRKPFVGPFKTLPKRRPSGTGRDLNLEERPPEVLTTRTAGPRVARESQFGPAQAEKARGEYAEALWAHLYQADGTSPVSYAAAGGPANTTAAEDD